LLQPLGSRLVLLYSSTSGSVEVRSRQARVQGILEGLLLDDQSLLLLDGANSENKQRRLELFLASGSKAHYPQLFVERPTCTSDNNGETTKTTTTYIGNAEDICAMHDNNTLGDAIGLVVMVHHHDSGVDEELDDTAKAASPIPGDHNKNTMKEESGPPPQEEEKVDVESTPPIMDLDSVTLSMPLTKIQAAKEQALPELPPTTVDPKIGLLVETTATSWVRQPSTRYFHHPGTNTKTKPGETLVPKEESSGSRLQGYQGSPPHEWAARQIQRTTRTLLLPVLKLQNHLKTIQEGILKDVQTIHKDTPKRIVKIQKQLEKDRKTVDQLAKDIRRQQKKEKSLKKDIKAEKKQRDFWKQVTKPHAKELQRWEKHTQRLQRYKKKVETEQKHLAQWDKDIVAVQEENERLLSAITAISEKLAMSGVNWTELTKGDSAKPSNKGDETKKEPDVAASDNKTTTPGVVAGTKMKVVGEEDKPMKPIVGAKSKPAPARVPQRARLQSILRRQEARRSVVAMVREESQRFGKPNSENDNKLNAEEAGPSPVYFVRLNSRAKLVT
jgi:hypothetical protein